MRGVILLIACSLVSVAFAEEKAAEETKKPIVRARVVTCGGCRLNSLPEVKAFLFEDLPHYHDARVRYSPGADPVLHLYDEEGKEVKKTDIADMNRGDISALLESHGLKKSESKMREQDQSEDEEEEPYPEEEMSPEEYPDEEDTDDTDELPEAGEDRSAEKEEL